MHARGHAYLPNVLNTVIDSAACFSIPAQVFDSKGGLHSWLADSYSGLVTRDVSFLVGGKWIRFRRNCVPSRVSTMYERGAWCRLLEKNCGWPLAFLFVVWKVAGYHGHRMLSGVVDVTAIFDGLGFGSRTFLKVSTFVLSFLLISNSTGDSSIPLKSELRNSSKARNASCLESPPFFRGSLTGCTFLSTSQLTSDSAD